MGAIEKVGRVYARFERRLRGDPHRIFQHRPLERARSTRLDQPIEYEQAPRTWDVSDPSSVAHPLNPGNPVHDLITPSSPSPKQQ